MSIVESEKRQLSPAEQLFQRLEQPLKKVDQAAELNNDAVRLFTEGQLTIDQLTKFSVGLAKGADQLADKVLRTDVKKLDSPELKQMAYSATLTLAQENRNRAVTLTMAQQQKEKPQPPRTAIKPK